MEGPWWGRTRTLVIGLGVIVVLGVLAQILNANVLSTQGGATKYGQLNVPESKVLELPAASFEGILEDPLEEELKITPALRLRVSVGGAGPDSGYLLDLDLGHSPPAGPWRIWLWTGIAAAAFLALWLVGRALASRRRA
jgi:hypothetical protein